MSHDTLLKETETPSTAESPQAEAAPKTTRRTWVEEIEVTGNQLVDRIKDLVKEGNTRRVIIKTQEGNELMTVPLTFGVVAGGLVAWAAPLLAAIGALAALVSRVKLEVIREDEDHPSG